MADSKKRPIYDIDQDKKNLQAWRDLFGGDDDEEEKETEEDKSPSLSDRVHNAVTAYGDNFRRTTIEPMRAEMKESNARDKDNLATYLSAVGADESADKLRLSASKDRSPNTTPGADFGPPASLRAANPRPDIQPTSPKPATPRSKPKASGKSFGPPSFLKPDAPAQEEEDSTPASAEPTEDPLLAALRDAKDEYRGEKDNLDKREAIEAIANAFGKIGAGLAGRASGTDMSTIKFDKQDWDKKRDFSQRDFQTRLADIADQRRERGQDERFNKGLAEETRYHDLQKDTQNKELDFRKGAQADENAYRNNLLQETSRHNKATESIMGAKVGAASQGLLAKATAKDLAEFKKSTEKASSTIYEIGKDVEAGRVSDEDAKERMRGVLTTQVGLAPADAEKALTNGGLWTSDADPSEVAARVNALAAGALAKKRFKAAAAANGNIVVVDKQGEMHEVGADEAQTAVAEGYKVLD